MPSPSLLSRPLSLIYITYLCTHILTTLLIDLLPLYPSFLQPSILLSTRADYISQYRDPLLLLQPAWFRAFLVVEAGYQVPLCFWGVWALGWGDKSTAPLHLLVYAVQTALTTGTCLVEIFAGVGEQMGLSWEEKVRLAWVYGGWAVVPIIMGLDMGDRVRRVLLENGARDGGKGRKVE